jgi:hypothetical protein
MATNPWDAFSDPAPAAGQTLVPVTPPRTSEGYERLPDGTMRPVTGGPADPTRPGGALDPAAHPPTEAENTAAFLAARVAGGVADLNRILRENPGAEAPEVDAALAGLFGQTARNLANSTGRQRVEAAQVDILDAALTLGTGAAYNREQLEGYRQSYFPQIGDSPETIADKQIRLRRLLEAARVKAGRAAPNIDAALSALSGETANQTADDIRASVAAAAQRQREAPQPAAQPPQGGGDDDPLTVDVYGGGTPEFDDAYEAARRSNPNLSRADFARQREQQRLIGPERGGGAEQVATLGINDAIANASPLGPLYAGLRPVLGQEGTDAFRRGVEDAATLGFRDEIGGVIGGAITGREIAEEIERQRAIDAYDTENNFGSRLGGQLVGGLALPGAGVTGVGRNLALGAAYGGTYGLGSGEGGVVDRLPNAAVGATIGAGAGALGGAIGRRAGERVEAAGPSPEEIGNAMLAENIRGGRPIADPSARGSMAYLETTRGGHNVVREGLEATRSDIEGGVGRIAGNGSAQTTGDMGQAIQSAGERRLGAQRRLARRYYDQADRASGGAQVRPTEAVQVLDAQIAGLRQNPNTNRALIDYLEQVRGDFVGPDGNVIPKSVGAIRDIRTNLAAEINHRGLGRSNADRLVGQALDAANADVARDLGQSAPQALRLYQQADGIWRQMVTDRRQVVERLIGPADNRLSGERVFANIQNMMRNRGDARRFDRVMEMMTPAERADFGATLMDGIGRASPEDVFSPARFLANTRDLQGGALLRVFGQDGAQAIHNLRLASRGFTDALGSLNNTRSGFVSNFKDFISSVTNLRSGAGGAAGFALGGLPGAVAGAVATEGVQRAVNWNSARVLMNTDVARWLRRVSKLNTPGALNASVRDLTRIASRNPAISQEVLGFQRVLMQAANDNSLARFPVAAESDPSRRDDR